MPARSFHREISPPTRSLPPTMDPPPAYTPQLITDLLPIYRPSDTDNHIHTYTLRQTSLSTQILSSTSSSGPPEDHLVKTYKTGGFMNRKPHVIITHPSRSDKSSLAEARFDVAGTGTTILYPRTPTSASSQRLELEDSRMQTLRTAINTRPAWWQPFPGNKDVLELTVLTADGEEEIWARFVHTTCSQSPARKSSVVSLKGQRFVEEEVGELHVVEALVGGEEERVQVLCSAITVVERTRRRRAVLSNRESPYGVVRSLSSSSAGYIPQ